MRPRADFVPSARRNRAVTASLVLAVVGGSRLALPDPELRAEGLALAVLSLGYGHLLGAFVFARRAARERGTERPDWLERSSWAVGLLTLFVAYASALSMLPGLALLLLAISTWHTVENDLELERAYARGLRLGPLPRSGSEHALALGWTALVSSLFLAVLENEAHHPFPVLASLPYAPGLARALAVSLGVAVGWGGRPGRRRAGAGLAVLAVALPLRTPPWLTFADLFAAVTAYHLCSFLWLFVERARLAARRSPAQARSLLGRLAVVHAPGLAIGASVALAPPGLGELAQRWLFSPDLYLFWSVLHVFQTLAARGRRPDEGAP